ncbi:hypothetical protein B0H66DRAFT_559994 [Apodospora peruviana]|uniref:Uncharacterized protein n=1 Tax=Apodospora peruviana TaxID=516989 RepID=A0AAE0M1M5_9PEZI|nr:hypothetical protein B0H66DRAFT_559994 [Apodospora peruviana]
MKSTLSFHPIEDDILHVDSYDANESSEPFYDSSFHTLSPAHDASPRTNLGGPSLYLSMRIFMTEGNHPAGHPGAKELPSSKNTHDTHNALKDDEREEEENSTGNGNGNTGTHLTSPGQHMDVHHYSLRASTRRFLVGCLVLGLLGVFLWWLYSIEIRVLLVRADDVPIPILGLYTFEVNRKIIHVSVPILGSFEFAAGFGERFSLTSYPPWAHRAVWMFRRMERKFQRMGLVMDLLDVV